MKRNPLVFALASLLTLALSATDASATEPCDDFGECKVLIEINATDGDIGFHFLMDGDELQGARIRDADGNLVFQHRAFGALSEQTLTETFAESAEPLCWEDPEADEDEEIVTLEEFLDRWLEGTYSFYGVSGLRPGSVEIAIGETELTYDLPAAPAEVDFDVATNIISWEAGDDLGNCATNEDLDNLVAAGILPMHPESVPVDAWEIVLEPDVDDGDPTGSLVFSIRVPGDIAVKQVTVPMDYIDSLPDDTPVKIEVGAIGGEDNATFTEEDGFCVNEDEGCEEEEEEGPALFRPQAPRNLGEPRTGQAGRTG